MHGHLYNSCSVGGGGRVVRVRVHSGAGGRGSCCIEGLGVGGGGVSGPESRTQSFVSHVKKSGLFVTPASEGKSVQQTFYNFSLHDRCHFFTSSSSQSSKVYT
jgi:hypothetical protein